MALDNLVVLFNDIHLLGEFIISVHRFTAHIFPAETEDLELIVNHVRIYNTWTVYYSLLTSTLIQKFMNLFWTHAAYIVVIMQAHKSLEI